MINQLTNFLLVDDDEVDVMAVKRAFYKHQIDNPCYVAGNGLEALEILRGKHRSVRIPKDRCLVLLDLNMPKMGGIEFLRELRADRTLSGLPVIVLTTSDEEQDRVEAFNLKVAGYIVKPVTFEKFMTTVAGYNRVPRQEIYR